MKVIFQVPGATDISAEIKPGTSLMRAALDNRVPGIYGDCGGQCACATCHLYIDRHWLERVGTPEPGSIEEGMLEGAPADVQPNSRLGCQILLTDQLDGIVVRVPEGQ
jgi:2Fe-2S ferredoxin